MSDGDREQPRTQDIESLRDLIRQIGRTRRILSPGLNLPRGLRRTVRYHPLFQSGSRTLMNVDREPFPLDLRAVGQLSPRWQVPWLKNYYERNPLALSRAASRPVQRQTYFAKNLPHGQVTPMTQWLTSQVHEVKPHQTLSGIAREHGVSLSVLKSHNDWLRNRQSGGLSGFHYLRPGDRIVVPSPNPVPRGRVDPFPREVGALASHMRQPWLRSYYEANPMARLHARDQARRIINATHTQLR